MAQKVESMCIYDLDKERCLRQEATLEQVLTDKKMRVTAISNYGNGYILRAGIADRLPRLEVAGEYWCRKPDVELSYEVISGLIDMLINKEIICVDYLK